jgi:hypothetical protein
MPEWVLWFGSGIGVLMLLRQFVSKIVKPAWEAVKTIVHLAEAHVTLLEIAEQFKPDGGLSLRDSIDRLESQTARIIDTADALANKVDVFILDRKPDGRRHSDP